MALRMMRMGDHDLDVLAHRAIRLALARVGRALGLGMAAVLLPPDALQTAKPIGTADVVWCVPGSPYRDAAGALCGRATDTTTGCLWINQAG